MPTKYYAVVTTYGDVELIRFGSGQELLAHYSGSGQCVRCSWELKASNLQEAKDEAQELGVYAYAERFKEPTGGTFRVSLGQGRETEDIPHDATPSAIRAAVDRASEAR